MNVERMRALFEEACAELEDSGGEYANKRASEIREEFDAAQGKSSHSQARDDAAELADVRVHALLQTFAMDGVDEDAIERLLKDALQTSYIAGHAKGRESAFEDVAADLHQRMAVK